MYKDDGLQDEQKHTYYWTVPLDILFSAQSSHKLLKKGYATVLKMATKTIKRDLIIFLFHNLVYATNSSYLNASKDF